MRRGRRLFLALVLMAYAPPAAAQEHPAGENTPSFQGFLFGDITFLTSKKPVTQGFLVGQLVGHGNAKLSDRLVFFGELSASARETGYLFEVERAIHGIPQDNPAGFVAVPIL